MTDKSKPDLIDKLLELDGVTKIHVETKVTVTHSMRNTGEMDENYQEIRESVVPDGTFLDIAQEYGWSHDGTVDVVGDFRLKDRFRKHETIDL